MSQFGIPLGDRLRLHLNRWKRFTRNPTVLSLIRDGLKLSFIADPTSLKKRAVLLKCKPEFQEMLIKQLNKFLQQKIIEVDLKTDEGFTSLFFPIPKKDPAKLRWILDLRGLNSVVKKKGYKMETINTIRQMILKDDWMVSIDIQDAFYHVLIHRKHRKFLTFTAINNLGRKTVYRFRTLPMGLTNSPWALSRIIGEIIRKLRSKGLRLSYFADDLILMAKTKEECQENLKLLVEK